MGSPVAPVMGLSGFHYISIFTICQYVSNSVCVTILLSFTTFYENILKVFKSPEDGRSSALVSAPFRSADLTEDRT